MAFTTRKSLLARVRAGDEVSWKEFYETYRPLVFLCGRDCGLRRDENEELVQQVMCEIFQKDILAKYDPNSIPEDVVFQYDPARGRFRHYLKGIIRNQARKIYHRRQGHVSIDEIAEPAAEEEQFDAAWEVEWRRHLLQEALIELRSQVQASTYAAFEMYTLQNRSVEEVAAFLNRSVGSVYVAKTRCIAILRTTIARLEQRGEE